MARSKRIVILFRLAMVAAVSLSQHAAADAPESLTLTLDPIAYGTVADGETYSGRVYVVFAPGPAPESRTPLERMHDWFTPPPLASWDVEGVLPGEPFKVTGLDRLHMHESFRESWGTGVWHAQAVARVSLDSPRPGEGEGDLYSPVFKVDMNMEGTAIATPEAVLSQRVTHEPFDESERIKRFTLRSNALSEFHGRDVFMEASVSLPDGWAPAAERVEHVSYPVVYVVTGFGGSPEGINRYLRAYAQGVDDGAGFSAEDAIVVVPDATAYWGHSTFANSATNGPCGDALVYELAPAIEAVFGGAGPGHRYVTGISSGGWASLWLQAAYPDSFAGCWSHAPDSVDFRAFQTVDIYSDDANLYTYAGGDGGVDGTGRRPIARRTDADGNDTVRIYADDLCCPRGRARPGRADRVLRRGL